MSSILVKKLVEHVTNEIVIDTFTREGLSAASLDLNIALPNSYRGEQEGYLHILLIGSSHTHTITGPEFANFFDPTTKLRVLHKGHMGALLGIPVYSDIFDEPAHRWLPSSTAKLVAVRMSEVDNYLLYKAMVVDFAS